VAQKRAKAKTPAPARRRAAKKKATPRKRKATAPPLETDPTAEVTLRQVLDNFGPGIAQVIVAPAGLEVPVGEPVIYDPVERPDLDAEAIVLAVGIPPDTTEARDLIVRASAAGVGMVVFKMSEKRCEWINEAEQRGLALISVADEMSWGSLHSFLALAVPSWRRTTALPGMASVPLGDLFALANAIAAMVGGAVTIEDPRARVLAYSNLEGQIIDEPRQQTILGRQVPDTPSVRALYRRLWASDGVIRADHLEGLEILPRLAVPVRVGGETIGSIWVLEGTTPLGSDAEDSLAEAARVAALHMIHVRASRDIDRRVRGDLLRSLLEGRGEGGSTAARLGIDSLRSVALIAFEFSTPPSAQEEVQRERLVDLVAMYSEAFRLDAACVALGRRVYAVLPLAREVEQPRMTKLAREILEHAESTLQVPLRAAISMRAQSVGEIPGAREEVDRILRVLAVSPHDGGVASIEEVQSKAILIELGDLATQHTDLINGPVQELAAHDEQKGTHYLETLGAYLEAFGDIPTAAERLGIHANTFRYRLRRLIELFELDLDDPDERLVLDLQLRLLRSVTLAGPNEGVSREEFA
jgi:sugar diacid utilization regulator